MMSFFHEGFEIEPDALTFLESEEMSIKVIKDFRKQLSISTFVAQDIKDSIKDLGKHLDIKGNCSLCHVELRPQVCYTVQIYLKRFPYWVRKQS